MKVYRFVLSLLVIALIAVSVSFYSNHRRYLAVKRQLKTYEKSTKAIKTDIQVIKNCVVGALGDISRCKSAKLHGIDEPFLFYDLVSSKTTQYVAKEIGKDIYDFDSIGFKDGDVVIDVGGNIGMVSIYLAKRFPFLKIYAFEPGKQNYENFLRNIKLNNIPDGVITVKNLAITGDGRDIELVVNLLNSGGSSNSSLGWASNMCGLEVNHDVHSVTLNQVFKQYGINNCKLLKIDCEGSEYEILYGADEATLQKCENLRMEVHENEILNKKFGPGSNLVEFAKKYIRDVKTSGIVHDY